MYHPENTSLYGFLKTIMCIFMKVFFSTHVFYIMSSSISLIANNFRNILTQWRNMIEFSPDNNYWSPAASWCRDCRSRHGSWSWSRWKIITSRDGFCFLSMKMMCYTNVCSMQKLSVLVSEAYEDAFQKSREVELLSSSFSLSFFTNKSNNINIDLESV